MAVRVAINGFGRTGRAAFRAAFESGADIADLVRAFTRTDAEIEQELTKDLLDRTMWIEPGKVEIEVRNGVAALSGRLHTRSDVELLNRLAARVPGLVAVESTVVWDVDDATRKGRRSLEQSVR